MFRNNSPKHKINRILLVGFIIATIGSISAASIPVKAQTSPTCIQPPFFDSGNGWVVLHGTVTNGGTALYGQPGTYQGINDNYGQATYVLPTDEIISQAQVAVTYEGLGDEYWANVVVILHDSTGATIDSWVKYFGPPNSLNSGTWTNYQGYFSSTSLTHEIEVVIQHPMLGNAPNNNVGVSFNDYCGFPQPPIPSPTVTYATYTPSVTVTASETSTPSQTPTPTNSFTPSITMTPSNTPTGTIFPTNTLAPTDTPGPTNTLAPTSLDTPSGSGISFNTPVPVDPQECGNTSIDPCGGLPFPRPVFATLNLPPPTLLQTITPGPGDRTGTAIAGGGTSTPGALLGTAIGYSTSIAVFSNGVQNLSSLTVNDVYGTPVSLPNAANEITSKVGFFWGAAREFGSENFGKTGILIAFVVLVNAVMLIIRIIVGIIQLVSWLWKIVSKILNALPLAGLLGI